MAFGSSPAPVGVATPIFVDIKDRPHPIFTQCPQIAKVDDSISAFSRVPDGVLYVEDVCAYIHYTLEDLGSIEIKTINMTNLLDRIGLMKLEFQILKDQSFTDILEMSEFKDEMIWYVLSRVHGEFIWLDRPYKITKEDIHAITSFPQTDQTPRRKKIPKNEVEKLTGATFDNRSMRISTIRDKVVQFASMIIGYKVTQSN